MSEILTAMGQGAQALGLVFLTLAFLRTPGLFPQWQLGGLRVAVKILAAGGCALAAYGSFLGALSVLPGGLSLEDAASFKRAGGPIVVGAMVWLVAGRLLPIMRVLWPSWADAKCLRDQARGKPAIAAAVQKRLGELFGVEADAWAKAQIRAGRGGNGAEGSIAEAK